MVLLWLIQVLIQVWHLVMIRSECFGINNCCSKNIDSSSEFYCTLFMWSVLFPTILGSNPVSSLLLLFIGVDLSPMHIWTIYYVFGINCLLRINLVIAYLWIYFGYFLCVPTSLWVLGRFKLSSYMCLLGLWGPN